MSDEEKFFIVSYDISDRMRLAKIGKAMKDYGTRVLMSVFECCLTDDTYQEMKQKMAGLMEQQTDSVRYYFICRKCIKNAESIGKKKTKHKEEEFTII